MVKVIGKMNIETLSNHTLGLAIGINPYDNSYTSRNKDGSFDTSLLTDYELDKLVDREEKAKDNPHIITPNDNICKAFEEIGFECGGIWLQQSDKYSSDWQHFEPNEEKMKVLLKKIK